MKIIKNIFLFSLIFVLSGFVSTASFVAFAQEDDYPSTLNCVQAPCPGSMTASTTSMPGPIFSTDYATNVTYNSATLNAMVFGLMDLYTTNNGQSVYFEYGTSENNLNMLSASNGPINGYFAKNITGLNSNTKYYYRVVVAFGPSSIPAYHKQYAGVMHFTTLAAPTQNTTTTTTTTTNTNTTTNNSTNTNNTTTNTNNTPVTTTTNTPQQEVRCPSGYVFNTTTGARCTTFDNTTSTNTNTTNTNTTNTNLTVESTLRYTSVIAMAQSVSTNLTLRSRGESVSNLQSFLIDQNKGVAAQNLAEAGATGYFGTLTRLALAEFQASVGITPASGYFGAITRAYIANNF